MSNALAYFNGDWVSSNQLQIPLDDLGFTMGVTIVERLRTFGGDLFRQEEHLQRLRRSLEIVGWDADSIVAKISEALSGFCERSTSHIAGGDDWYVVALVTPGKTPDAATPTVCVHGGPLEFSAWASKFDEGVSAVVVDTRQVPANCWPADIKCRSRLHYYLADQEAALKSPGARAILLDQEGFVGEASTANVVAYFPERGLVTPPRSKVLPGVTQQVLFELATVLGIPTEEIDFTPEEMLEAAEVFFTSTSICLLPVVSIDEHAIGGGTPGSVYRRLLAAWTDLTGVDVRAQAQRFAKRNA